MARFPAPQKAFQGAAGQDALLTSSPQRCRTTENGGGKSLAQKQKPCTHGGRTPMADKSNDPVAIWQTMVGEMEKGFNAFANQAMASPEFSKVVNQVGGVTAGAQKQLGDLMEKYLASMNLPSRAQMVGMAERLQSIEGQLNEIKATLHQMQTSSGAPQEESADARPRRTRKPPSSGGEQK
jgi:cytochrome c1